MEELAFEEHPLPVFDIPARIRARWKHCHVRPAGLNDVPFLAWVVQESARSHMPIGIWDRIFPEDEKSRLSWLQKILTIKPVSLCHYSLFLIAEYRGESAAAISMHDPSTQGLEAFTPHLIEFLRREGWKSEDLFGLVVKFAPYHSCLPKMMPGALVAEWAATKPEARDSALMFLLFEHLLVRARSLKYSHLQASHYIGNHVAQKGLLRMKFQYCDETTSTRFLEQYGCPGMARYLYPC